MTRFAKYIYILTAPIAAAAILTACSSSDDAPDKGGSSLSEISLSVVFSGSEGSRAGENKWEVIDRPHDADAFVFNNNRSVVEIGANPSGRFCILDCVGENVG